MNPDLAIESTRHLFTGWWTFLHHNVARVRPDPSLWIPALVAVLVCTLILHQTARRLHIRHPLSAAVSLVALLPVLFATAFLVPGIILQLQLLAAGR